MVPLYLNKPSQIIGSMLNKGEEMKKVKVVGSFKENNGNIIGKYDSNPMLNTMVYDVKFTDGSIQDYGANVIVDNMYSQVDSESVLHYILYGILDFAKDTTAVQKSHQYIITKSGQRLMQKSTVGWNLLISWKDGSKQWIPLLVINNLIQLMSPNLKLPMVYLMKPPLNGGSHTHSGKGIKLFLMSMTG